MEDTITINYNFAFKDGLTKAFSVNLSKDTLCLLTSKTLTPPSWTELDKYKCSICGFDGNTTRYCPVAVNLSGIAEEFRDYFAYENVSVAVSTDERTYVKDTTIQEGLSALLGIIMVTSGCPAMEYLKPMVRFHLPFATLTDTIFRMSSVYLMAQYFLNQEGRAAVWSLEGIEKIYSAVSQVNRDFAQRLTEAAKKDANANALVNLDCFASMIPLAVENTLAEIKRYFSAYLAD